MNGLILRAINFADGLELLLHVLSYSLIGFIFICSYSSLFIFDGKSPSVNILLYIIIRGGQANCFLNHKLQIRKFLGSFCHQKSAIFFDMPLCKSKIHKFSRLIRKSQIQKYLQNTEQLSDSYPAFFLPIATTSNKNF